jgi:hypothetical protein
VQVALIRANWQRPSHHLKVAISFNETIRKRDMKKLRAREPGCDWHWYAARERKRRARIAELRVKAEAAALNDQIRADLFGKRTK